MSILKQLQMNIMKNFHGHTEKDVENSCELYIKPEGFPYLFKIRKALSKKDIKKLLSNLREIGKNIDDESAIFEIYSNANGMVLFDCSVNIFGLVDQSKTSLGANPIDIVRQNEIDVAYNAPISFVRIGQVVLSPKENGYLYSDCRLNSRNKILIMRYNKLTKSMEQVRSWANFEDFIDDIFKKGSRLYCNSGRSVALQKYTNTNMFFGDNYEKN